MLGICYGMQALRADARRPVEGAEVGEFGRSRLTVARDGPAARRHCRPSRRAGCRTATPCTRRRPASPRWPRSTESPVAALEDVERGIYGIQFHPEVVHTPYGQQILTTLPGGHLRLRAHVERRLDHRRADRRDPRAGRRRPRHLRALRRRGLQRRRAARAPRDRRPAHVRVRRPRPDAQERGRAGDLRLPRPLQGPARGRRRRGPLPARGCRGVSEPEAKRKAIGAEFIRVFEEEAAKLGDAQATSSRARSTPT